MFKKIIVITGAVISLVILTGATFYISFRRSINEPAQRESEEVVFTVEPQTGVSVISGKLETAGLVKSSFYFDLYAVFKKIDRQIQAGEYALNKNMNIREIAKILSRGEAESRERTIKVIEGWRISDIAAYLVKEGVIVDEDDFVSLTKNEPGTCFVLPACEASFLSGIPAGVSLEGYLFPDTYRIFRDATAADVIAKMLNTLDVHLTPPLRADISASGRTLHEIVTMASIIEKEVRTPEDMKVVSGLFWNRLDIGMALQSDATLSYALGDKKPAHTLEELELDSPYNTYKYGGLPPAPVSNPGLNALTAAIYPSETDYLYFLSDLETGKTYFAKTLDEHNRNKALYLR